MSYEAPRGLNLATVSILVLLLAAAGCGEGDGAGDSASVATLQPFQGAWQLSTAKTLQQWEADRVPSDEIDQARQQGQMFPLHPDLTIRDRQATLAGVVEGSYDFFSLHPHGKWTCGRAWHHEDRHDPGDMSKCLVRLQLVGADLHMALRFDDRPANPNDPDLVTMPAAGGSDETCTADTVPDPPFSPWRTFVFERRHD